MDEIETILSCPICKNQLKLFQKSYQCIHCNSEFPIENNIGILVPSPSEHLAMIDQKMKGITGDWYSADQLKSYETGPYHHHLQKRQKYVSGVLKELNKKSKIKNLLDLGCGDGSNLRWLSQFSENLWGTDYNLLRLERARKTLEGLNNNVRLFLADIFSLPFHKNSFDTIFFNHVIEHLKNDRLALEKIFQITKKGGHVILGTPNEGVLAWKFAYFIEPNVMKKSDHVNFYTADSIKKIAEKAGFKILHTEHIGWGVPIWKVDPILRKHKFFDDVLESIGRNLFYKQATSLYLILEKE